MSPSIDFTRNAPNSMVVRPGQILIKTKHQGLVRADLDKVVCLVVHRTRIYIKFKSTQLVLVDCTLEQAINKLKQAGFFEK